MIKSGLANPAGDDRYRRWKRLHLLLKRALMMIGVCNLPLALALLGVSVLHKYGEASNDNPNQTCGRIWECGGQRGGYPGSANAASTVFKFAPTSSLPPRLTNGRRISRGSCSINSTIHSSVSSWSAKPICFRLGLRRAKIWETPTS